MRILCWLAVCVLLALGGCRDTLNVGGGWGGGEGIRLTGVSFSSPNPIAGNDVTATISFNGVVGPFTFNVHFDSSVTPADQTVVAPAGATSATLTFTLDTFSATREPAGRDVAVNVAGTDSLGVVGLISGTFHVSGTIIDPGFISGVANGGTVTITSSDSNGEDVTIMATAPAGFSPATDTRTIAGGNGTVDFTFSATDILAGAAGDISFTASDVNGSGNTITVGLSLPGFVPAADTLYAIPARNEIAAGEPVTITVVTGDPANPLQYMAGVRVCVPAAAGAEYVKRSFNVGTPGNDPDVVDGAWTSMGISDGDFLLAPDSFYPIWDSGDGRAAFDFNVTPLGGSDQAAFSGALFNFQLTFTNPGTWDITFQQTNLVNRTYYQDGNQAPDYLWGDLSNSAPGAPHSVTVN